LDIDNFKQINDQFGHRTGDQALKDISQIIKLNSRLTDIASRWGGEEFLILLPHTNKEGARILSERLRLSIANFNFHGLDTVTCSFGIAEFDPDQDTESDIIKKADAALYEAKRSGKNRVALAGSTPGD
jgi:diguanylate cyclase (GGDEF)-like protein